MRFAFKFRMMMIGAVLCATANAQQKINAATGINYPPITGTAVPTAACTSANYGQPYQRTGVTPNIYYTCGSDGWAVRTGPPGPVGPPGPGAVSAITTNGTAGPAVLASTILNIPVYAQAPVSGALAEYAMNEGTGTVVHDISGNGHDANFATGSNAPTWTPYGISFLDGQVSGNPQQNVITPLATFGTVYIAECTGNLPQTTGTGGGNNPVGQYPTFLGATSFPTEGEILMTNQLVLTGYMGVRPSIKAALGGGIPNTSDAGTHNGCHVYGYAASSSADTLTVDGVQIPNYTAQGATLQYVPLTGGTYEFGGSGLGDNTALQGVISYAMFYSATHTLAQMSQTSIYIQNQLNARPLFPKYPLLTNLMGSQAVFCCDSLTATYLGSAQWTTTLTLNKTYNITNIGVAGMLALDGCGLGLQRWQQLTVSGATTILFWAGTNDISQGFTAQQTWNNLAVCAAAAKRLGARTIVATMISRAAHDAGKDTLNPIIRQSWKSAPFDAMFDYAESVLGADGAYANTACYPEEVHLTGPGTGTCGFYQGTDYSGYGLIAAMASAGINSLDGSSIYAPDVTSSNALAMTRANNYVLQAPTTAATAMLPDCQGATTPYTIVNVSTSTNTITVSPFTGQAMFGSTAAITQGQTGIFTPILISNAAAGCSWIPAVH